MKRTTKFVMASALVLMIVVMSAVSSPASWTQASASMTAKVSGPGTVRMVVRGLNQGQPVSLYVQSPSGELRFVGRKTPNSQGVIHATEVLGNSVEKGTWKAAGQIGGVDVASTQFQI